jgi:hypothetical protein
MKQIYSPSPIATPRFILIGWFALPIFLCCLVSSAAAQSANVHVFASGLIEPRGLKFGPDGNLYVAEAGTGGSLSTQGMCDQVPPPIGPQKGGFTSRISKITPAGVRTTVIDKLPATVDAMSDFIGISDVGFIGNTLYALSSGAGCAHGHATADNALLKVSADNTTTTVVADLSVYLKSHPVANPPAGDFDPEGEWYNMVVARGAFVAVEANHGELDMITTTGQVTRIADISATQGHAVPTAVAYDGDFYVGNLNTFPIVDGSCKILKITPDGQVSTFATGFTTILGLAFDSIHRLYVLETTTGGNQFPTPGTGKVLRVDATGTSEEIATGLSLPTAMTFGPDGYLYVSNWGFGPPTLGEIVRIGVQPVASELANISTRAFVQTADNVMIGGFILRGSSGTHKVLIRAIGPSLASSSVSNALADPTLDLRDVNGTTLAFNDNWKDNADQASKISATGIPPKNDLESAIVADLPAGQYTAIVAGKSGGTGVGLVEIYNLTN